MAGVVEPLSAQLHDSFLAAEQGFCRDAANQNQNMWRHQFDLAFDEG